MQTDNQKQKTLVGAQKEVSQAPEESMEYWFTKSPSDVEEGEVVRGRVVEVRDSEVLVDIGYKSEGTVGIEEFRYTGTAEAGEAVVKAIERVLLDGPRTRDMGGTAGTAEVGRAIADAI